MNPEDQVTEQLKQEGIVDEQETKKTPQTEKQEEKVLTEFEQEQHSKGWNPDGPKSAEEWARAEPLYEELKQRGREIKQLKRTLDELKDHMSKQEQVAYDKALKDLIQQRDIAVSQGNNELVNLIDQEAQELEQSKPVEIHPAVKDFQERNEEWLYDTSYEAMEMQRFAIERDKQLLSKKLSPDEHVELLEEHIKKKFPSYFNQNESVGTGASVESGSVNSTTRSKRKHEFKDLTSEQKQAARDFEKLGVMSIDEYIKQVVENGDLV